jgi:hypothetical protein
MDCIRPNRRLRPYPRLMCHRSRFKEIPPSEFAHGCRTRCAEGVEKSAFLRERHSVDFPLIELSRKDLT